MNKISITIEKNENKDFCNVRIQQEGSYDILFAFNMEYLFEWVDPEHHTLFLTEVFSKKIEFEWNVSEIDWNSIDLNSIVSNMKKLWI